MNLYKIELNGLGTHYVVAKDPTAAYRLIRGEYDAKEYGFSKQRALVTVTLIAECSEYPENGIRLWMEANQ